MAIFALPCLRVRGVGCRYDDRCLFFQIYFCTKRQKAQHRANYDFCLGFLRVFVMSLISRFVSKPDVLALFKKVFFKNIGVRALICSC